MPLKSSLSSKYFFVSSHLRILKSALDNTVFWKDYWAFDDFEFSRSQLINIHEKIGTRERSPDNWGLDNRGLTVTLCDCMRCLQNSCCFVCFSLRGWKAKQGNKETKDVQGSRYSSQIYIYIFNHNMIVLIRCTFYWQLPCSKLGWSWKLSLQQHSSEVSFYENEERGSWKRLNSSASHGDANGRSAFHFY